jgi:hypothetical protein
VRELSHYLFSWVAQEPGEKGVLTLRLGRRALLFGTQPVGAD